MRKLIPVCLIVFFTTALLFSCSKERSVENGSNGTPATGSILKDSQNFCTSPVVHGTYYTGKPLGDTNYVEITIVVGKPGSYTISTDEQQGFSFSDSGFFTTAGAQTIKLKGKGTPANTATITDFTVSFDTAYCTFSINVLDSTGTGGGPVTDTDDPNESDTAWRFSDDRPAAYSGFIDSAVISTRTTTSGQAYKVFYLVGSTSTSTSQRDSLFQIAIALPGNDLTLGTYTLSQGNAAFSFGVLTQSGYSTSYSAESTASGPPANGTAFTMNVESYNTTTRVVTGSFYGTAVTPSGTPVNFTGGQYKARVQN